MRGLIQDVRCRGGMLVRSPGFTLASVLCLTIGIGLTAAVHSQLRSSVFRALPGAGEPKGLVRLHRPFPCPCGARSRPSIPLSPCSR